MVNPDKEPNREAALCMGANQAFRVTDDICLTAALSEYPQSI